MASRPLGETNEQADKDAESTNTKQETTEHIDPKRLTQVQAAQAHTSDASTAPREQYTPTVILVPGCGKLWCKAAPAAKWWVNDRSETIHTTHYEHESNEDVNHKQ